MTAAMYVSAFWLVLGWVVAILVVRKARRDVPSGPRVRVEQRRGQR